MSNASLRKSLNNIFYGGPDDWLILEALMQKYKTPTPDKLYISICFYNKKSNTTILFMLKATQRSLLFYPYSPYFFGFIRGRPTPLYSKPLATADTWSIWLRKSIILLPRINDLARAKSSPLN